MEQMFGHQLYIILMKAFQLVEAHALEKFIYKNLPRVVSLPIFVLQPLWNILLIKVELLLLLKFMKIQKILHLDINEVILLSKDLEVMPLQARTLKKSSQLMTGNYLKMMMILVNTILTSLFMFRVPDIARQPAMEATKMALAMDQKPILLLLSQRQLG